jgi:hypothetical protein
MRPDTSQWRSSESYDFTDDLAAADLAWEFLRRNEDYQTDAAMHLTMQGETVPLDIGLERRWGLRFCGKSQSNCPCSTGLLVSASRYRRRHFHLIA